MQQHAVCLKRQSTNCYFKSGQCNVAVADADDLLFIRCISRFIVLRFFIAAGVDGVGTQRELASAITTWTPGPSFGAFGSFAQKRGAAEDGTHDS